MSNFTFFHPVFAFSLFNLAFSVVVAAAAAAAVVVVVVVVVVDAVCQMASIHFPNYCFQAACISYAALMMYFFTVALTWMLVEGVQLYLQVTRVFKGKQNMPLYYVFAWGKRYTSHSVG